MSEALRNRFYTPGYLLWMMRDYLKDHALLYETREGSRKMKVTSGATREFILYFIRFELLHELLLLKYTDDVAALVTAHTVKKAQRTLDMVRR